jgi:hypothetical protein
VRSDVRWVGHHTPWPLQSDGWLLKWVRVLHNIREPEWNICGGPAPGDSISTRLAIERTVNPIQHLPALAGRQRRAIRRGSPLSPGARSRRQRVGTIVSATEAAARSAIRDGAINRVGRSTHPGQQRTDLPRRDLHPELLRHASSQFIIGQNLAEETNEIICMVSLENHMVPWMEHRLEANPAAWDEAIMLTIA